MRKFRKKPVVIEAVQLQRRFEWPDWFHDAVTANQIITHGLGEYGEGPVYCEMTTIHGEKAIAREGDWIIPDAKPGTFYPCNPDVFAATYEPVE